MRPALPSIAPISRRLLTGLALALLSLGALAQGSKAADYPEIQWEELVPRDWNPADSFRDLQHLAGLPDSDDRVQELYDRMRKVWDEAPTVPQLEGKAVKIPGFIVPLEGNANGLREFLLVPYFGACIHTPPPPANQIILVRSKTPLKGFETMSAVWVSGTLGRERKGSDMGVSGYSLQAARVVKYTGK
ncbi:hypothetical protein AZ34_05860 [Hylemonella gracilis str. Niagara R]|uniref:DUF3299 domain-containing protein n=1 Tax=Hylemonella gracilis str. Niagara R TaxID=1458275 RepID=A0A016XGF8_9BURK|nr:DUF3299 domain-containing protein [Hylemonella gracilis]EYC50632.1 hypothetical protein AZ34_05860 [Hylemonella gracilis str. Niagara R]